LGKVSIRVFPGKGKEEVGVQTEGDSEKGILEIEDRKVSSIRGGHSRGLYKDLGPMGGWG
jgi:hypothetical protein